MRVLITLFAVCIVCYATPSPAQYYYYGYNNQGLPSYSYETAPTYGYYKTPNGWGERGSNGWTYHSNDGFNAGRDSNGCMYAGDWSNC
jgi:hypothetical protein